MHFICFQHDFYRVPLDKKSIESSSWQSWGRMTEKEKNNLLKKKYDWMGRVKKMVNGLLKRTFWKNIYIHIIYYIVYYIYKRRNNNENADIYWSENVRLLISKALFILLEIFFV